MKVKRTVHSLIKRELKVPDKKAFIPKTISCRLLFVKEDEKNWVNHPKVDVPLAKITKNSALLQSLTDTFFAWKEEGVKPPSEVALKRTYNEVGDFISSYIQ